MKGEFRFLNEALLFCCVIFVVSADITKEDGVLVLKNENFDEIVKEAELILVEFYAPWCGHCKHLAPEYVKAAAELSKLDPPVPLAKVDATVETELASRFSVRSYPTLKIFRHGAPSDYNGPREAKGIIAYMERQIGPSYKVIKTSDELKRAIEENDMRREPTVVGFFPEQSDSGYEHFVKAADYFRDQSRFLQVNEKSIASEYGYDTPYGTVVIFKRFDDVDPEISFKDFHSGSSLISWVNENSLPLVGVFNRDTEARYKKLRLPLVKVYIDVDFLGVNRKRTIYYINRVRKTAAENLSLREKVSFVAIDRKEYASDMARFGFEEKGLVSVGIDDLVKGQKFRMTEEFSAESLLTFVNDFVDHKLKPYIKSQPIPEKNDLPVKVVVGETFRDIVLDPKKDVLLEMYAPWCGHCKKLEPVYNQLAETLKDTENLVIAKMDAVANDSPHPKYQARGFPTILFAPAGNKENPIPYSGERNEKAFIDFLKQKAVASVFSPTKTTRKEKEEL